MIFHITMCVDMSVLDLDPVMIKFLDLVFILTLLGLLTRVLTVLWCILHPSFVLNAVDIDHCVHWHSNTNFPSLQFQARPSYSSLVHHVGSLDCIRLHP